MVNAELKKSYEGLQKKYSLPALSKIGDYVDINKIESDGDRVLRDIRKTLMDRIGEYARLIEMLINPSNAPGMFAQFAKILEHEDRKLLERVYEKLVSLELHAMELDLEYEEKKEAEGIVAIYDVWNYSAGDLKSIITMMRRNFESKSPKKERSYFG